MKLDDVFQKFLEEDQKQDYYLGIKYINIIKGNHDKNYYEIFINNLDTLGEDEDAECEKQDVIVGRFIDYLNENEIEYDFEEDILEVFEYINSYDTKEYIGDDK